MISAHAAVRISRKEDQWHLCEECKNVKAENLEVTVHDNMKEWVDKEICFENAVVKEK